MLSGPRADGNQSIPSHTRLLALAFRTQHIDVKVLCVASEMVRYATIWLQLHLHLQPLPREFGMVLIQAK